MTNNKQKGDFNETNIPNILFPSYKDFIKMTNRRDFQISKRISRNELSRHFLCKHDTRENIPTSVPKSRSCDVRSFEKLYSFSS